MRGDAQLFSQNLTVSGSLVEHVDVVAVLENVLDFLGSQQVFDVLRDSGWNAAPFSKALPNLHAVGGGLLFLEQHVEFVHIVSGRFAFGPVSGHAAPDLILHDEHAQLLELFAQLLDVIAHKPVIHIHVGTMIEHVEGAGHIDFQRRGQLLRFLFLLLPEGVVQVFKDRHILRPGIIEVGLVDDVNRTVDNRLFNRLQSIPPANDQLTERQDKVRFERQRVIIVAVIQIDVHRVDIVAACGRDADNLSVKGVDQRIIFALGIADDDVIVGHEEDVADFTLGRKRFARAGRTENQSVWILELFPVNHNQVVGKSVQPAVQCLPGGLEQLLRCEGDEDRGG